GHDHQLLALELDLGAGVAGEDDLVALLDADRDALALVRPLAVADGQHLASAGLLLGRVGQDDATLGLALGLQPLDQDLVAEGTQLSHVYLLLMEPEGLLLPPPGPRGRVSSYGSRVTGYSPAPLVRGESQGT